MTGGDTRSELATAKDEKADDTFKYEVFTPTHDEHTAAASQVSLKEIQSWWQVASIIHFSSVFRPAFSLPEFEFDARLQFTIRCSLLCFHVLLLKFLQEFEDALLRDKPGEENLFLSYLTIDLLKGCLASDSIT